MAGVHSRAPPAETPRRSRSLIEALHDEAHRPDVKGVTGGLSELQNADEVFAIRGRVIGRHRRRRAGESVTRHDDSPRSTCTFWPASRRREPTRQSRSATSAIDRMLAAVDAAVPEALGLDPKSVTMTQLVNRVAHPRPGRELRRGDAALASTGESRKALRHSADRDLCRAARDSEAHFDDVIGDGRRRRNVEEVIHRAPAAAIRAILMANSRLIVIQPRSKPVTWPSSFLTGVSTARRGLGNGTTFANERRR